MRRNVAEDVPSRWPPSEVCSAARTCDSASASTTASIAGATRAERPGSEIDIELQPPLGTGPVVGRVVDRADVDEVVHTVHVVGIERALAPDVAATGDRVDPVR